MDNEENELVNPDFFLNPALLEQTQAYEKDNTFEYKAFDMNDDRRSN